MKIKAMTILAILLALILGVLLGMIIRPSFTVLPPTVIREDMRPAVPVVNITGVEDGNIIGSAKGSVRVFLGDEMALPDGSGSFRVPAKDLLRQVTIVKIPSGMRFVASKRGKKYYPVASAAAAKLAPANRVYFPDADAAERAGFLSGQ